MRRSGAPSQLRGNATKKPRFMPPGPAQNDDLSRVELGPSPPSTPALGNVLLNKVKRRGCQSSIFHKSIMHNNFKLCVCNYNSLSIIRIKHENNINN